MRANPRSAILQALQEGPRDIVQLWWSLGAAQVGRGGVRDISALEQRALCKLIRSRKVVRLGDGRYARRQRSGIVHPHKDVALYGGTLTVYMNDKAHEIKINPGDSAQAIADRVKSATGLAVGVHSADDLRGLAQRVSDT